MKRHGWCAYSLTFDEISGARKRSASARSSILVTRRSTKLIIEKYCAEAGVSATAVNEEPALLLGLAPGG